MTSMMMIKAITPPTEAPTMMATLVSGGGEEGGSGEEGGGEGGGGDDGGGRGDGGANGGDGGDGGCGGGSGVLQT